MCVVFSNRCALWFLYWKLRHFDMHFLLGWLLPCFKCMSALQHCLIWMFVVFRRRLKLHSLWCGEQFYGISGPVRLYKWVFPECHNTGMLSLFHFGSSLYFLHISFWCSFMYGVFNGLLCQWHKLSLMQYCWVRMLGMFRWRLKLYTMRFFRKLDHC